jgi:hypothetical protein
MVYNNQNYWISGLRPSFGILNIRQHIVLENVSVLVLNERIGQMYQFPITGLITGPLEQFLKRCVF